MFRRRLVAVSGGCAAVAVVCCLALVGLGGGTAASPSARTGTHPATGTRAARQTTPVGKTTAAVAVAAAPVVASSGTAVASSGTAVAGQAPAASVAASPTVPSAATASLPTVAALVARVEAAGIDPGSTWSWSMGNTATGCGAISGDGTATGCTSWSSGTVHTVFEGSPALSLVAHEVANAEVEMDATAALLAQVAASAGSASWSPTDAVASCLVSNTLGFQDDAAGTWQCPASLGAYVAAHIHDHTVTTTTTAVCGTASGTPSTLTFGAGAGTLTVTGPVSGAAAQVAQAGGSLTVSGTGTFTAVDVGGVPVVSGVCQA